MFKLRRVIELENIHIKRVAPRTLFMEKLLQTPGCFSSLPEITMFVLLFEVDI